MSKFVFPTVEAEVVETFTMEQAKALLEKNTTNRPRSSTLKKRYRDKMIRKRWRQNGEPIIISRTGKMLSGQHRCEALVDAEELRLKKPKMFKERFGWSGPITIPVVLVTGIRDEDANTLDLGKKRGPSDIVYRLHMFDEFKDPNNPKKPEFSEGDRKKLSMDLATAVRTVWLRLNAKQVKDAPKFDEDEMIVFLEQHPKIREAVLHVYREDNGKEKQISSMVTRSYMAAVMYLAGTSTTDREQFEKDHVIDLENWQEAEDFVVNFAQGVDLHEGNPALVLRKIFTKQRADGGTRDRDVTLNLLINAIDAHLEQKTVSVKDVTPKKDDRPCLGGLDDPSYEPPVIEDEEEDKPKEKEIKAAAKSKKPAKKKAKATEEELEPVDVASEPVKKPTKSKAKAKSKKAVPEPEERFDDADDDDIDE